MEQGNRSPKKGQVKSQTEGVKEITQVRATGN